MHRLPVGVLQTNSRLPMPCGIVLGECRVCNSICPQKFQDQAHKKTWGVCSGARLIAPPPSPYKGRTGPQAPTAHFGLVSCRSAPFQARMFLLADNWPVVPFGEGCWSLRPCAFILKSIRCPPAFCKSGAVPCSAHLPVRYISATP